MEFLKSNLWEIKKSSSLQIFGGLLALIHALTYWNWMQAGNLPLQYHANPQPMCWGLFESCQWVKILSPTAMEMLFHAYGVIAVLAVAVFLFTRFTGLGWFMLMTLLILKSLFYFQDLRLTSNVHYAIFVMSFCYLFIPNKANLLRWLLISFYVASGLLRLSPNWLTGQFFIEQLHVPVKLGEWLAGMTVLAEMIGPVVLLFRDLRNFLIGYIVLIVFHGLMIYAGGYFEPTVMLILLQLMPLLYYEERKIEREYLYQSFIRPEPSPFWLALGLGVFWLVQALPYVPHQAGKAIAHFEEVLALQPVAAAEECESTTFAVFQNRLAEVVVAPPQDRPTAFRCNPYLRFLDLKSSCRDMQKDSEFKTLMSYFRVRGLKDKTFQPTFSSEDFCRTDLSYQDLVGGTLGI